MFVREQFVCVRARVVAQDLEKELQDSITCLNHMGILLEEYSGPEKEACYFDTINQVVAHYDRLYAMRGAVTDRVPVKVIEDYLDKGLNPELYTKHQLKYADELYQVRTLSATHDYSTWQLEPEMGGCRGCTCNSHVMYFACHQSTIQYTQCNFTPAPWPRVLCKSKI